jgi:dTDP-4-amino-4,6-dideoxygalactose transaminase
VDGCLVANSGKHVYYNWDPIMKHLGAHCDAMNPYNLPQNQGLRTEYTADMLPKTLDLVNRTYHFNLNCDWTEAEIQAVADTIRELCAQV